MRLRSSLMWLVVATVIPVVGFAVAVSAILVEHENENFVRAVKDRNRAFMSAVDAELKGHVAALQALAAATSLRRDDLQTFQHELAAVLGTQAGWVNVNLMSPEGRHLVNGAVPFGTPLPTAPQQPETLAKLRETLQPTVGNVFVRGPLIARSGIPVRVPVMRDGRLAYVLTAVVKPETFEPLIRNQHLPDGWISGLVDGAGNFVARIPERPVGTRAGERYLQEVALEPEGWWRGTTAEGRDSFTAHASSAFSGWSVGLAIPPEVVYAGPSRALWSMGIGALVCLGAALVIAWWLGRRISTPIAELAAKADGIGRHEDAIDVQGGMQEVRQLVSALAASSQAIRERREAMERESELLRASDRAKEEFLAMLSHELRNPLAAMSSSVQVLEAAPPESRAFTMARQIMDRQMRHMTRLIEDLLDVSRIAMGKAHLERQPFDLAELATRVIETWQQSGRLAGHRVELDLQGVRVDADRARMEQVVSNLLDNAVKFTPAGKRIRVEVARAGDDARLAIADEGRGIEGADLARIFDLFVQGPHDPSRHEGGMGIGLALVKRLVEMHGGSVTVASGGAGAGTRFEVRIPAMRGVVAIDRSLPSEPATPVDA